MKASRSTALIRLALSFAISPLVAALLLGSWILIETDMAGWRTPSMIVRDTVTFSYLAVFLLGLPLTLLFAVLRAKRWWHYTMAGFVLGVALMAASYQLIPVSDLPAAGEEDYYQPIDWLRSLSFGVIAAFTASAFWWLRYGSFGWKSSAGSATRF